MQEFQHKRKIKNKLYSKTVIVILFFLLIYFIWDVIGAYSRKKESDRILQKINSDYQALVFRSQNIKTSIDRLNTPNGVEEEIKQKFNVVKEGEKVAVIVDDNNVSATPTISPPKSFLGKLGNWFANIFK